jgi:hypothetical protein
MKESTARTVRTSVQTLIAVAAAMPVTLPALGIQTSVGFGAALVTIAAAITRLHQIPAVNELLNKYLKIPK